jgi:archaellum component FlaG (FlaF/FlaG flagellin family)
MPSIGSLLRGNLVPTAFAGEFDASTGSYPQNVVPGSIFIVSVAGTVSSIDYEVGDNILFDGTQWRSVGSSSGGGLEFTPFDASTGSYPASPSAGDALVVTTAGTISGIDYVIGDTILFNGTDWVTVSVDSSVIEWDVTPAFTPATTTPFAISVPASTDVTISGANSDVIQPDRSGVVGPIENDRHVSVAVLNGTISTANRQRMNLTVNSFTQTGSGELQVFMGWTNSPATLVADLTLMSDDNTAITATEMFAARVHSTNNTTLDRVSNFFLTTTSTPGQPTGSGNIGTPAATGTLSAVLSNFDVPTVGIDVDGVIGAFNNEAVGFALGQFGVINLPSAALSLTPFFAIVSTYDGSAWSTANVTIEPFPANPTATITPGSTGLPQGAFDQFVTNAQGAGSSTPESYTQVTTLPPNTKDNDIIKAIVSDSYAGAADQVLPLNGSEILQDDRLLLVTNAAVGSESFITVDGRTFTAQDTTVQVPHRSLNFSNAAAANGNAPFPDDDYRIYKRSGNFGNSLEIFEFGIGGGYFEYDFEGGLTLSQAQFITFRLLNSTQSQNVTITIATNEYELNTATNKPTIQVELNGVQQAIHDRTLNNSFGNTTFGFGIDLANNTLHFLYNDADTGNQTLAIDFSSLTDLANDTAVNFLMTATRARVPVFTNTGIEPYVYTIPAGLGSLPQDSFALSTTSAALTMSTTTYDPTAGLEIANENPGTIQRVSNTGTFDGKQFTRGHYALWDGSETTPFPQVTTEPEQNLAIPLYGGENISLSEEDIVDGMTYVQIAPGGGDQILTSTISLPNVSTLLIGTVINIVVNRPGTIIISGTNQVSPAGPSFSNLLSDTIEGSRLSNVGVVQFMATSSTWIPITYDGPVVRSLTGGTHTVGSDFNNTFSPENSNTRYYFASTGQTATVIFNANDNGNVKYAMGHQLHFDIMANNGSLTFQAGTATLFFANGRSTYTEGTHATATYVGNDRWIIDGTTFAPTIPANRSSEVLLQPGGTPDPSNHIYDNWTDAYNACVAIAGPVTMKVDTAQSSTTGSITILSNNFQSVRTAVVPTGTWALRPNQITIEGVYINDISDASGSETISRPVGLGFTNGAFLDQVGEIKNISFHVNKTLVENTILTTRTVSENGNGIPYNHFTNCKFFIQNTEESVIQTSSNEIAVVFEGDFVYCDNSDNSSTNNNSALVSGIIGDTARITFKGPGDVLHYTGWPGDDAPRFANDALIFIDDTRDAEQMRQLLSDKTVLSNTLTGGVTVVQNTSQQRIEAGTVGANTTYVSNANEMQWQTDYSNIVTIGSATTYLLPTRTTGGFSPSALPLDGRNYYVRSAGWDITFFVNITTGTLTITPPSGNTINGVAGDLVISSTGIQQVLVKFNATTNDFVVKVI